MQLKSVFSMLALSAALVAGSSAQAAFVDFNLSSTAGTDFDSNGNIVVTGPNGTVTLNAGTMTQVPGDPNTHLNTGIAGTNVNFAAPTISSTALNTAPQFASFNYNYAVTILTTLSPTPFTFNVSGTISGNFSAGTANNTSVTQFATSGTQGDMFVNVTLAPPSAPSTLGTSPTPFSPGTLTVNVNASAAVPEPTSIALMGMGAVGLVGLVARRRRAV